MSTPLNIGIVGLGVMGQRMLERIDAHPRLQAACVWDADAAALQRTLAARPALRGAADAAQLIATPGLHGLYIATPPAAHMALSEAAFDAGLAVLCEKPLTVDFEAARRCIARIEREGRRAAVNFSLASSPGLQGCSRPVARALRAWAGCSRWTSNWRFQPGRGPGRRRPGCGWRSAPRAASCARCCRTSSSCCSACSGRPLCWPARWPIRTTASARRRRCRRACRWAACRCRSRAGSTPGRCRPTTTAWSGKAAEGAIELREWFALSQRRAGEDWVALGDAAAMRAAGQAAQLEQWVALIEGRAHGLPGFAEALAVQQTIEDLLAGR
jgi:hypothetical protein